jgi:hypothetical protein
VNAPACPQWACHSYRRGREPGKTQSQVRGFPIFDKRAQAYTTSGARGPNSPSLLRDKYRRSHVRLEKLGDRDKIRGEGNRHRGYRSTHWQYYRRLLRRLLTIVTHKPVGKTGERSVPPTLGVWDSRLDSTWLIPSMG